MKLKEPLQVFNESCMICCSVGTIVKIKSRKKFIILVEQGIKEKDKRDYEFLNGGFSLTRNF